MSRGRDTWLSFAVPLVNEEVFVVSLDEMGFLRICSAVSSSFRVLHCAEAKAGFFLVSSIS
jgi:hypothetical protein